MKYKRQVRRIAQFFIVLSFTVSSAERASGSEKQRNCVSEIRKTLLQGYETLRTGGVDGVKLCVVSSYHKPSAKLGEKSKPRQKSPDVALK
jgi:hypothetical protein